MMNDSLDDMRKGRRERKLIQEGSATGIGPIEKAWEDPESGIVRYKTRDVMGLSRRNESGSD